MNISWAVKVALASLALPIHANVYNGTDAEYITFNYADERPIVRADDDDLVDETTVQIHYFTKGNPLPKKESIRYLLRQNGFTIISTQEFYESDTKLHHVVVEAWIEGVINDATEDTVLFAFGNDLFIVADE